jgi:hypothetical protein
LASQFDAELGASAMTRPEMIFYTVSSVLGLGGLWYWYFFT